MKKTRKLLSVFMAVAMLLCSAPMSGVAKIDFSSIFTQKASAETYGDYDYRIDGDKAIITSYHGSSLIVTVPDTINGKKVTEIGDYSFSQNTKIMMVTLKNGITKIGSHAFSWCSKLSSVSLPSTLTEIGCDAFHSCALTSITIPNSVIRICSGAFSDCKSLSSISFGSSLQYIESAAFSGCNKVTDLTIPSTVTKLGGLAFSSMESLKTVTINGTITDFGNAFLDNPSLTKVVFKDGTKKIGDSAFEYCRRLTSVTLPSTLTEIGIGSFGRCSSLTSIVIPDKVTKIGNSAFYECTELSSISFGSSLQYIESLAFCGCKKITDLTIPSTVTKLGTAAFRDMESLRTVTINGSVTSFGETVFSANPSLTKVIINEGTTEIGSNSFSYCPNLQTVHIPTTVKSGKIGTGMFTYSPPATICCNTSSCYAKTYASQNGIPFKVCSNHSTVTPPATSYTGTFKDCNGTKTVSGTKITTPSISSKSGWTSIGWCGSTSSTSVDVNANTSYTLSGNKTFYALYKKDITFSFNANGGYSAPSSQNLTLYYNASGYTKNAVFNIPTSQPSRDGYAFKGWSTNKNATSASYSSGQRVEITESSPTTLYAVWEKNPTTPDKPSPVREKIYLSYKDYYTLSFSDFRPIRYYSEDTYVATVSDNGQIYAAGNGVTTIHAVDIYGNERLIDVDVSYSFFQWIIVIVLFGWLWY